MGEYPSNEPRYQRARAMNVSKVIQCDGCLKWRQIPFQSNQVGREPPDNWICSHNPDTRHNKCTIKEEVPQIQEATFKKEEKTSDQQRLEIQAKMDKFKRELDMVNRRDFPTSSRTGKRSGSLPSRPRLPSSPGAIKKKKMRKRLVQRDSESDDDNDSASQNGDDENDEESVVGKVVEYNDGKKWQPGR